MRLPIALILHGSVLLFGDFLEFHEILLRFLHVPELFANLGGVIVSARQVRIKPHCIAKLMQCVLRIPGFFQQYSRLE
jgi:hypothetical protein